MIVIPVSRWTEVRKSDIPAESELKVLVDSPETGLCLLDDPRHRALHMFNHVEYDTTSLADEYFRDIQAQPETKVPANYFPEMTRRASRKTAGAATHIFCLETGSTRCINRPPYDLQNIAALRAHSA